MPNTQSQPLIEERALTDLFPHPKQEEMFGDLPAATFQELKTDIETNGLREPIEILPDGMILSGHQRHRVLLALQQCTAKVRVRYDLAAADESAIESEFLSANTARRQLSPLAQARIIVRRHEIKTGMPLSRMYAHQLHALRVQLEQALDMTTRNVSRYLAVLRTPRIVQDAFDAERLTLQQAAKVATLRSNVQAEIAAALQKTDDAKACVKSYFVANRKPQQTRNALRNYLFAVREAMAKIRPNINNAETNKYEQTVELLREGIEFNKAVIEQLEANELLWSEL